MALSVVTVCVCSRVVCRTVSLHKISGIGKSTLLRHIAMREVPIPAHITILFVEQEVRDFEDVWGTDRDPI